MHARYWRYGTHHTLPKKCRNFKSGFLSLIFTQLHVDNDVVIHLACHIEASLIACGQWHSEGCSAPGGGGHTHVFANSRLNDQTIHGTIRLHWQWYFCTCTCREMQFPFIVSCYKLNCHIKRHQTMLYPMCTWSWLADAFSLCIY